MRLLSSERRVHLYIAVVVAGAAAASFAVQQLDGQVGIVPPSSVLSVALIALLAQFLSYQLPAGESVGSIALIPFISAILLSPDVRTAYAIGAVTFVSYAAKKKPLDRTIFNTAQSAGAIALGILAFRYVGGRAFVWDALSNPRALTGQDLANSFGPIAVLSVVLIAANTIVVSGVVAISQEVKWLPVWRANTLSTATFYVFAVPSAYGLSYVETRWGVVGAVLLALPFIGIRQLYKTALQLHRTNQELLELMIKAIEARDPYTSGHSRRVADASVVIARAVGLSGRVVERVRVAALLHDIGKIHESFAPILQKEGKLTSDEWNVMKTHPGKGAALVETLSDLRDVVSPIRHHHEAWDGRGYPDGLAGEAIPLAARIIAFADTLDALTTDRPYRRAMGEAEVRAEFLRCSGTQFDPSLCARIVEPQTWTMLFSQRSRSYTPERVLKLVASPEPPTAAKRA